MKNFNNYSVLMSVYYKENPKFLKESMNSIFNQTVKTNDFVLVCDGPLTEELDKVIDEEQKKFGKILNVVSLPENKGLGNALKIGIEKCKNELIARMDSDDISMPDRCERELNIFLNNDVDIVSGTLLEFDINIDNIINSRILPENNEEIRKFAKGRCPFNHPCVMYKKNSVKKAGGYKDFYHLEDYFLWIRMLQNGSIGYNIQEPILWMRSGNNMYKRRSGIKYIMSQSKLLKYMYKTKFISLSQYLKMMIVRTVVSLMPNCLRMSFYNIFLRK